MCNLNYQLAQITNKTGQNNSRRVHRDNTDTLLYPISQFNAKHARAIAYADKPLLLRHTTADTQ